VVLMRPNLCRSSDGAVSPRRTGIRTMEGWGKCLANKVKDAALNRPFRKLSGGGYRQGRWVACTPQLLLNLFRSYEDDLNSPRRAFCYRGRRRNHTPSIFGQIVQCLLNLGCVCIHNFVFPGGGTRASQCAPGEQQGCAAKSTQ